MMWQIFTIITILLLGLKILEMGLHCRDLLRGGRSSIMVVEIKAWPIARRFKRLGLPHLFRLPVLVLIATILVDTWQVPPDWVIWVGASVFIALVVEVLQVFLSRLKLGDEDAHFRRLSLTPPTIPSPAPAQNCRNEAQDYVMFILGLIGTVIVGYACIFASIEQYETGSFTASDPKNGYPPVDFLYFSTVTFATIGYGDIAPLKPLARVAVISEVIASIISLVLLMFVYSSTVRRSAPPPQ